MHNCEHRGGQVKLLGTDVVPQAKQWIVDSRRSKLRQYVSPLPHMRLAEPDDADTIRCGGRSLTHLVPSASSSRPMLPTLSTNSRAYKPLEWELT